jgi:uncharacterized protein YndB with AHSA1/START domain
MKWALIAVGIVVTVVAFVVVVGALLPRDHVATLAARIAAPPSAVWATITDPTGFTTWRSDVTRIEMLASTPSGPSWREYSRHGAITMVIDAAEPPRRLVTRIADEKLPFGGRWEFDRARRRRVEPRGHLRARVGVQSRVSIRVTLCHGPHAIDQRVFARARKTLRQRADADDRCRRGRIAWDMRRRVARA